VYWKVPFRNLLSQGLWAGQNILVQFFLRFGSLSLGWGEPFPEAHWSGRIERVCVLQGVWKWCGWHEDKLLCNCCSCSTNNHMTMKSLTLFITMHARLLQLWTTCTHACTLPPASTTDKMVYAPTHLTVSIRISASSPLFSVDNSPPSYTSWTIQWHVETLHIKYCYML